MRKLIALAVIVILTLFFTQCVYGKTRKELNALNDPRPSVSAVPGGLQRLSFSVEAVSNTFDGSALGECTTQHEIESGKKYQMWISFGRVKPLVDKGWEAVGSNTHCGDGSFDKAGVQLGLPYIIIDIETIPSVRPGGKADLQMTLQIRKLSAFDKRGKPVYVRSKQKRRFDLGTGDYAIVPLLVADTLERDAFNVHELFVRFEARVLGQEQASYGTISVEEDVSGIDILLDGGLVGRTLEKNPVVLRNVRVGKHEVRVSDLSRRTAWQQVTVEKDKTVEVDLNLLNLPSSPTKTDLMPIGKNPQGYEEYWRTRDRAVVVKVPAGEFLMGSAEGRGEPSEHPQRRVFVTEFLIDKTEVTWRQFRKFVEAKGISLPPVPLWGTPGDYPVSNVLFNEAKTYCEWAGGRLPTEAEWEKAARGEDGREYPWGNEWDPDRCNSLKGGPHRPEGVGSFPDCLSPYGLLDMAGSVWEWCTDWYADGYPEGSARDPNGPETGSQRVVRGASWLNMSEWLRVAYRHKSDPLWRNVLHGFRCAQSAPPAAEPHSTEVERAPSERTRNVIVKDLSSTGAVAPTYPMTISIEAFANTVAGSPGLRCDASNEVEAGKQTEWWLTIGEAKPNPQGGWEVVGNEVRCGAGSFEKSNVRSGSSSQTPYLMATISTMAAVAAYRLGPEKVLQVDISLSVRKLSEFGATVEPKYEQSAEKRTFFLVDRGTVFLPLVIADEKEKEAFKLHEALIGVGAKLAEKKGVATYGEVSVSSDLDGAGILLDGGMVGRVSAGKETILTNILAGDHEVSVRDSSARDILKVVRVEQNRTAMVSLKLSDSAHKAVPYRLVFLGKNIHGYGEYRREMDDAIVVRIPAGEFLMGNKETEGQPLEHKVDVSEFLIDKTGVTWGQFKKFAGAMGASLPPNPPYWGIHDDQPAVFVTWEESKAYCEWAGGRLPTEAEREKAARWTDKRKYPWGNEEPDSKRAVFRRNWGNQATDPVGAHPTGASPYGLLDMGGNVWEWVVDWYDDKYYEVSPQRNPKGPRTGQAHVVRGGSWDSRPSVLSASCRNFGYRGYREGDFGFRCAMDPMD